MPELQLKSNVLHYFSLLEIILFNQILQRSFDPDTLRSYYRAKGILTHKQNLSKNKSNK